MAVSFDNSSSTCRGTNHYRWTLESGATLCYAYIRKNACSAFKRYLSSEVLPHGTPWAEASRPIVCPSRQCAISSDYVVFVYRDPIERVVSGYVNKCIQLSGNHDVARSLLGTLGKSIEEVSFREFVEAYLPLLKKDPRSVDVHFRPMHWHLMPLKYTHAIAIDNLAEEMVSLIGARLAGSYFQKPVNTSSALYRSHRQEASLSGLDADRTPRELIPSVKKPFFPGFDFLAPDLCALLRDLYDVDYAMLDRLSPGSSG